jgi:hypothetical protein
MNPSRAMQDTKTLLEEDNVISLRTAFVLDNGNRVSFQLMPVDFGLALKKRREKLVHLVSCF